MQSLHRHETQELYMSHSTHWCDKNFTQCFSHIKIRLLQFNRSPTYTLHQPKNKQKLTARIIFN